MRRFSGEAAQKSLDLVNFTGWSLPCSLAVPPLLLGMQVGFLWISFIFDSETMLSPFIFPLVSHISGGLHPTPLPSFVKASTMGPSASPGRFRALLLPFSGSGHGMAPATARRQRYGRAWWPLWPWCGRRRMSQKVSICNNHYWLFRSI